MRTNIITKRNFTNRIQKQEIYCLKLKNVWFLGIFFLLINACTSTFVSKAERNYYNGNYDEAVRLYTQTLATQKATLSKEQISTIYKSRGIAYHSKGDYDNALADYDNAISLTPDSAWTYSRRASTYRAKREYSLAKADHNKAIVMKSDRTNVYFFRRGADMFLMGEYEQAIKDLRKSIQLTSRSDLHPQVFAWLYLATERAGKNGREILENGLRNFNPNKWPTHILSMYLGDIDPKTVWVEAFREDRIKNLAANRCAAYFHVAEGYLLKNNKEKAIEMFKKSQKYLCPNDIESDASKEELKRLGS